MAEQDNRSKKGPAGCFGMMRDMMRNMISGKQGSSCSCSENMTEMMSACCSPKTEKDSSETHKQDAPR